MVNSCKVISVVAFVPVCEPNYPVAIEAPKRSSAFKLLSKESLVALQLVPTPTITRSVLPLLERLHLWLSVILIEYYETAKKGRYLDKHEK